MVHEEIFGPVAPVCRFETDAEAIARANDTEYGLAAYVFTRDLERGMRSRGEIEAGMIALNRGLMSDPAAPFGGVKQSGLGREGGSITASLSSWRRSISPRPSDERSVETRFAFATMSCPISTTIVADYRRAQCGHAARRCPLWRRRRLWQCPRRAARPVLSP